MSQGLANSGNKPRGGTVRSFVAVPLPADSRTAILAAVHEPGADGAPGLAARLPDVRWSLRPENLHVTLKFLGQVDPALLARFGAELSAALAPVAGFDVGLRGFGAFPSLRDAQVVWVGIDDPARRLAGVAGIVDDVAGRLSVVADRVEDRAAPPRPFRAHVTVGRTPRRARHGIDATAVLAPTSMSMSMSMSISVSMSDRDFGRVPVTEIHLYESITGGDASTYVLRGKATLEGATHGDGKDRDQGRN